MRRTSGDDNLSRQERRKTLLDGKPVGNFTCTKCKANKCSFCIDVVRYIAGLPSICKCMSRNHSGEPFNNQILDPDTGSVYAPGMEVKPDGTISRNS